MSHNIQQGAAKVLPWLAAPPFLFLIYVYHNTMSHIKENKLPNM